MFIAARLIVICSCVLVVQFSSNVTSGQQGRVVTEDRYARYVDGLIRRFDKDKDGYLDSNELSAIRRPPQGADSDNDGKVSREEYISYYQSKAEAANSSKSDNVQDATLESETPQKFKVIYLHHANAKTVKETASSLLNLEGVRCVADKRLNALVVLGTAERLERLSDLVSMIDVESKSKSTAEAKLLGMLSGRGGGAIMGGLTSSKGGANHSPRVAPRSSKQSKKSKVNNKRVRVAMTFLRAPKDVESQGGFDLRETSFEDLPEKIQALVDVGFEILDQGASATFDGVKSDFSVGATKPFVVSQTTSRQGTTQKFINNKNIGSTFEFEPELRGETGRLKFNFTKVLVDEVAREKDTPASYNLVNITISNTIACRSNGTSAVTYRTDGQLFILVIGTRIED